MAVEGVPKHAHCEICGTPVKVGERWCSTACEEKHEEIQAQKKKSMWKFVALLAGLLILLQLFRLGVI